MTYLYIAIVVVLILVLSFILFVVCVDVFLPNWIYKGPKTKHFNGRRFFFPGVAKRTPIDVFKWMLTRKPVKWPDHRPLERKYSPPPERVSGDTPLVTFISHASILVQWRNLNILIDPVYAETLGPQYCTWFNIKRVHEPGVSFDDLPPIDLVLVSHSHYDHMDIDVLKELSDTHQPLMVTGLGCKSFFDKKNIPNVVELDWWDSHTPAQDFKITFLPAIHSSNRSIFDVDFTLWGGFAIELKDQGYIYFSSDTGYGSHWKEIKAKLGPPRLAILPIGAYEVRWFMKRVHMNPEDMLQSMEDLSAQYGMAVHFGMFPLADEGIDEPVDFLSSFMREKSLSNDYIWIPYPGESRNF